MEVRLTATGTRPLLMHNERLASPLSSYAQELARLNKAKPSKVRTDEDRLQMARVEWEGGLYFEEGIGPYVPASWVFRNLLNAARSGRRGKKVEGGIQIKELMHPLIYKGPRTIEELWGDGKTGYVDFRSTRVQSSRVDRCRPIFKTWAMEAVIITDPSVIDVEELADIATIGGKLHGYGDYRQQYGRFDAAVEKI